MESQLKSIEDFTIVTGHKNGKVALWKNSKIKEYLFDYKDTIINIKSFEGGVLIQTQRKIFFWDLNFVQNYQTLEMNIFPLLLYSQELCCLQSSGQMIFLVTTAGDIIQINTDELEKNNNLYECSKKVSGFQTLKGSLKVMCLSEYEGESVL